MLGGVVEPLARWLAVANQVPEQHNAEPHSDDDVIDEMATGCQLTDPLT